MRQFVIALIASVLLTACQEDMPSAQLETSPGGLEYWRLHIPEAKQVILRIGWETDWTFRPQASQAVPYIGADLILEGGAQGYPAGEVVETFADLQAEGSIWIRPTNVIGTLVAPTANFSKAVDIANAHLRSPLLPKDGFIRLQEAFAGRMTEAAAIPGNKMMESFYWAAFGDTPMRRMLAYDVGGEIALATRDEVAQWHRQTLVRSGAKIVIAGAVDAKEAGAAVDALLAGLPEGAASKLPTPKANFAPRRILLHAPDSQTSGLIFMAPFPSVGEVEGDGDSDANDAILVSALGGDDQSILFDVARTQLRASYGVYASLGGYANTLRTLSFQGEIETAKLAEAETALLAGYADFQKKGPSGDLAQRKATYRAASEAAVKDPASASLISLYALIAKQDPNLLLNVKPALEKLDMPSLMTRLGKDFPTPNSFMVLAFSPDAKALPGACVITQPAEAVNCR